MATGAPTLAQVKAWLGVSDTVDDVVLAAGLAAAIAYQEGNLNMPAAYTADLTLACYLRTARYLARRASPEGVVGFSEFGPVSIALSDRDVAQLESPYVPAVAV